MSGLQRIDNVLERTARRRRLDNALKGLWQGVFWGAVLFLLALAAFKLFPIPVTSLAVGGIAGGITVVLFTIFGAWKKPSKSETARWVDERQHLKERLSSAIELGGRSSAGHWNELVVKDASDHVDGLDPRRLLPFHLNRFAHWSVLILVLAACLGFVPEYRSKDYEQTKQQEAVIKDAGRMLADLTKRSLEQKPPAMKPTEQALQAVNETGLEMSKANLSREDALKELASVTDKLNEQMKEMAKNPALKKMDQALKRQDQSAATPDSPSELQKKLEEFQKALGKAADEQEAMNKMKSDLEAMKQKAAQMASEEGGLSDEQKRQMAEQLAQMSQQAQQMGANLPGLEAAMEALMANQTDFFMKDLDMAMADLEKMQQMAEAMSQLEQQLSKIGKDLAEQLEFGQANAAVDSLKKMMEQLKDANLSKEQMAKLMEDLKKSLDPAKDYGKVAEKLAKALGECKAGDKEGAGESMAAAAKELEELLAQMGDVESMMATLEALKMAQLSVSNCQGLGQCRTGMSRPGKGNKMGKGGFGTWAEENGWIPSQMEISELWENGEDTRKESAKGITDRGDGELVEGTTPTKVRGQMSPGGNMPSITLKGVSIKGQSKVDYAEAVATAQSDAQSALSEDKVPRAYQGAVRDYFDDLK